MKKATVAVAKEAVKALATMHALRKKLFAVQKAQEQIVDHINQDEFLADRTGFSRDLVHRSRGAKSTLNSSVKCLFQVDRFRYIGSSRSSSS